MCHTVIGAWQGVAWGVLVPSGRVEARAWLNPVFPQLSTLG